MACSKKHTKHIHFSLLIPTRYHIVLLLIWVQITGFLPLELWMSKICKENCQIQKPDSLLWISCVCFLSGVCDCDCVGDGGGESHVQWAAGAETGAPTKRKPQQAARGGACQRHEGAGSHLLCINAESEPRPILNMRRIVKSNVSSLENIMYSHEQDDHSA